ncbi:MAG: GGDEF domain-containing protein [Bacillota bacterium]|nr:GGDEF domain-containing protein [Bacillota bacterium]
MNLYFKEDEVCKEAEKLLLDDIFSSPADKEHYLVLFKEYRKLLKQMRRMVKMSDLMQNELKILSHKLEQMSSIDSLTGLFNRRYFNEVYQKEWLSACRSQVSLAALMLDIDNFKKYNDTYGHLRGDKCLQAVAEAVRKAVKRPRDMVARYGGEEFVIILTETDASGAFYIAEQAQNNVRQLKIEHSASSFQIVSVSIGVAAMIPSSENHPEELLNMADEALYRSKSNGRNSISLHTKE